MKKTIYVGLLTAGILGMTGCGGSSDLSGDDAPTTLSAQFIDSAVQGLSYDCQSSGKTGVTDSAGTFNYFAGDTCTFKVGTVTLGSAQPSGTILTPRDLSNDPVIVTNTLRLLQTLDSDGNPDNGITLPEGITGAIDLGQNFDTDIQNFLDTNNVQNAVVTAEEAEAHFEDSISIDITDDMFIGKTYTFNDVTVDFYSDHTLRMNGDGDVDKILSWEIVNNQLTLSDNTTLTFYLDATAKVVGDNSTIIESYTVTDTPITLTNDMFIGKTYTITDSDGAFVYSFYDNHTYTVTGGDGDGQPRAWSIDTTRNIIHLIDSDTGESFDWELTSSTDMTITALYADATVAETVENVPYTVTDTQQLTLTADMFNGKTYTFGESPDQTVINFVEGGNYTEDGSYGTWTINTDNTMVLNDTESPTTITFYDNEMAKIVGDNATVIQAFTVADTTL